MLRERRHFITPPGRRIQPDPAGSPALFTRFLPVLSTGFGFAKVSVVLTYLLLVFSTGIVPAKEHVPPENRRGCSLDHASYDGIPLIAPLKRGGARDSLPPSISLKHFAPTPGDQGDRPTNAAWAVAYGAYTCIKAIEQNCSVQATIDAMAFSPGYIYAATFHGSNPGCDKGFSLTQALDAMTGRGTVNARDFPDECDNALPEAVKKRALENRIFAYRRLFGDQSEAKVRPLKECLAAKRPVVAALWYVGSFDAAGEVWVPGREEAYRGFGPQDSGIAVTVVGYDDNRFGGAFEVMNSLGTGWGEGGFCWITYEVFDRFCVQAFDMIVDPSMGPSDDVRLPDVILPPTSAEATIGASVNVVDLYQRQINASRDGEVYRVNGAEITGSQFKIQITATTDLFVYIISSEGQFSRTLPIFPDPRFRQSEQLMAGGQMIIPPPGSGYIQQVGSAGVDHFCFLFSVRRRDVADLVRRIDDQNGEFIVRVRAALAAESVANQDITFSEYGGVSFWTADRSRNVVALFVDMHH